MNPKNSVSFWPSPIVNKTTNQESGSMDIDDAGKFLRDLLVLRASGKLVDVARILGELSVDPSEFLFRNWTDTEHYARHMFTISSDYKGEKGRLNCFVRPPYYEIDRVLQIGQKKPAGYFSGHGSKTALFEVDGDYDLLLKLALKYFDLSLGSGWKSPVNEKDIIWLSDSYNHL